MLSTVLTFPDPKYAMGQNWIYDVSLTPLLFEYNVGSSELNSIEQNEIPSLQFRSDFSPQLHALDVSCFIGFYTMSKSLSSHFAASLIEIPSYISLISDLQFDSVDNTNYTQVFCLQIP